MKDFNFFEELSDNRKKKTSTSTYILAAAILLMLVLGAISYYYIHEFRTLRSEKAALESQMNDKNHQQQYQEAVALQEQVTALEKEKTDLEKVHDEVLASRVIGSLLLKEIALAKPDAVAIKSIFLTRDGIGVEGASISYDHIARFEYNLRANEKFAGPFIPVIQKVDEDNYSFTLNFTFTQPETDLEGEDVVNGEN